MEERIEQDYATTIDKKCPHCGGGPMVKAKLAAPDMPTYQCKACGGGGYYLTDLHLEYLVSTYKTLFSPTELKELSTDKPAFIAELKEYIIRIFASKRIARIK